MAACASPGGKQSGKDALLLFTIHQERDVYERSDYGEPPQFAIWIESIETGEIKTIFVTHRTATGDFEGKAECPVSLPAWIGAFRKETGRNDIPSIRKPVDVISGATPKVRKFSVQIVIPGGSRWYYFIEVNVSGDYTQDFPSVKADGTIDTQGNGQPSIIYKGEITGVPGNHSTPDLIGRTEQLYLSTNINNDLNGIVSAKVVFSDISVTCSKTKP